LGAVSFFDHFAGDIGTGGVKKRVGSPLFTSGEGERTDDWAVPWLGDLGQLPGRPED